jgi:hypothetical protein
MQVHPGNENAVGGDTVEHALSRGGRRARSVSKAMPASGKAVCTSGTCTVSPQIIN